MALHRNQCAAALGDAWLGSIVEFSRALHSMQLDVSAFACLSALALVNGECACATRGAIEVGGRLLCLEAD